MNRQVCSECGSDNVYLDAWVDANTGDVVSTFEQAHCGDCEGETHLVDDTTPRCDECGVVDEEAFEWCGNCGNCGRHCANEEGCGESIEYDTVQPTDTTTEEEA